VFLLSEKENCEHLQEGYKPVSLVNDCIEGPSREEIFWAVKTVKGARMRSLVEIVQEQKQFLILLMYK
jgi:hypothetical protein